MIDLWLRSGTAAIVVLPIIVCFAMAAFIVWLTHLSPARPFFLSCVGIVGPFFTSVAILFGLFAAFLANDVDRADGHAQAAVMHEADGLRTLLRLAEALGEPAAPLKAAAIAYGEQVLRDEWPSMRAGKVNEDLGAMRALSIAALAPGLIAATAPAVHQTLLAALVEVRQARMERMSLTARESHPVAWFAVFLLGFLTQVAVAAVQLDKLRPQALALGIFTAAFAGTVALIAVNERPFAGRMIDDAPIRAAIGSANL
jgi:hypothetical protein